MNNSYYALQEAKKTYFKENPGKTEKDWDNLGVMKQDEYIDVEMQKLGYVNKTYIGSGANIYSK